MSSDVRTAVVLDRHPLWLDAIGCVLEGEGITVVGKTTQGWRAVELIGELLPNLLVTEITVGGTPGDGLTCVREARERHPELRAIVVSAQSEPESIDAALEAGALAYVVKTAQPEDIASAVRQAFEHSIYLPRTRRGGTSGATRSSSAAAGLTRREREILRLASEGYSNSELARMLWVTEQTVKFHLSNIYRKLKVSNRTEAARWAQLHGLLSEERTQLSVA
jgi:DNA-binding NarL/FixJ family response regulator